MNKYSYYISIFIIGVVVLGIGIFGGAYYYSTMIDGKVVIPEIVDVEPKGNVVIGENVTVSLQIKLPAYRAVDECDIEVGEKLIKVGKPNIKIVKTGLLYREWLIEGIIRPIMLGKSENGVFSIKLSQAKAGDNMRIFTAVIPELDIIVSDNKSEEIILARKFANNNVNKVSIAKLSIIITLSIIIVAFIVALIFHRKGKIHEIPPWQTSLIALDVLESDVKNRKISVEVAVARLTDVVRNYLENRFDLPISKQTTIEFMQNIERKNSFLNLVHLPFLKEFLSVADEIKFALLPGDEELFTKAVSSAKELIEETTPRQSDNENGNNKIVIRGGE